MVRFLRLRLMIWKINWLCTLNNFRTTSSQTNHRCQNLISKSIRWTSQNATSTRRLFNHPRSQLEKVPKITSITTRSYKPNTKLMHHFSKRKDSLKESQRPFVSIKIGNPTHRDFATHATPSRPWKEEKHGKLRWITSISSQKKSLLLNVQI